MATTDFGKEIKIRLVELEKEQSWLIERVKEETGDYFDSSYLYRIMNGKLPSERGRNGKPGKADVIREILGLEKAAPSTFYENYITLCNHIGKAPSAVALEIGLTKPAVHRWKSGGTPTDATAKKVADYFGVTVGFMFGEIGKGVMK